MNFTSHFHDVVGDKLFENINVIKNKNLFEKVLVQSICDLHLRAGAMKIKIEWATNSQKLINSLAKLPKEIKICKDLTDFDQKSKLSRLSRFSSGSNQKVEK